MSGSLLPSGNCPFILQSASNTPLQVQHLVPIQEARTATLQVLDSGTCFKSTWQRRFDGGFQTDAALKGEAKVQSLPTRTALVQHHRVAIFSTVAFNTNRPGVENGYPRQRLMCTLGSQRCYHHWKSKRCSSFSAAIFCVMESRILHICH